MQDKAIHAWTYISLHRSAAGYYIFSPQIQDLPWYWVKLTSKQFDLCDHWKVGQGHSSGNNRTKLDHPSCKICWDIERKASPMTNIAAICWMILVGHVLMISPRPHIENSTNSIKFYVNVINELYNNTFENYQMLIHHWRSIDVARNFDWCGGTKLTSTEIFT